MDLQEWELLSDNGLLEVLHDDRDKFLSMEYTSSSKKVPNQVVIPLLIQQEPSIQKPQEDEEVIKEVITKVPLEVNMLPPNIKVSNFRSRSSHLKA